MHQSPIKKALYVFIFLAIANNINAQTSTQKASVENLYTGYKLAFLVFGVIMKQDSQTPLPYVQKLVLMQIFLMQSLLALMINFF